jgi:hypothetical protein
LREVHGGASEFSFAVAAGVAHQSTNPKVTIQFARDAWALDPSCSVQDRKDADLSRLGGVAIREFPMPGFGEADRF